MIEFHQPTLADRSWVSPLLNQYGDLSSEAAFGTFYLWQSRFSYEIAQVAGCFVARDSFGTLFPVGGAGTAQALQELLADASERGVTLRLQCSEQFRPQLEQLYPDQFRFTEDPANYDYLYRVSDLIDLEGKKYHAKRNHIARFMKDYDYTFEPVSSARQAQECIGLMEQWCSANEDAADFADELTAIRYAFSAHEELQLKAGLLRVDGRVIAFAAGEEINSRVFDQHFEKALTEYDGAYAVINHDFMRYCLSGYELVNREEDMGIEGLRKAKLSYNPEQLFVKYTAERVSV